MIKRALIFALTLALIPVLPAVAVENGKDATGSPFVVPIMTETDPLNSENCSGAIISPLIIVTAAHCVLDINGLVSKGIYVGNPGSSMVSAYSRINQVKTVQITSDFKNGSNATVGTDDLAFLTISDPLPLTESVSLVSEAEMLSMRNSAEWLMIVGYGSTSDASNSASLNPNTYSGSFITITNALYPNSGYVRSSLGDTCKGDSGGPVLSITKGKVTLVGIVTGAKLKNSCTTQESDGSYLTLFSIVGRYANLAFAAAVDSMSTQQVQSTTATTDAQTQADDLISQVNDLTQNNWDLTASLEEASQQIKDLTNKYTACIASAKKILSTKKGKLPNGC